MPFFTDHKHDFILEPPHPMTGLRKCQLGAIWALKSHFITTPNEVAALISMPTGSGKTALMMAACFELGLSKTLIIEPTTILRRQICEQFRNLNILKNLGCLKTDTPNVNVYEVEHRIQNEQAWIDIINNHDVIVAHPNCISPHYTNLTPITPNLIDAVIMDEAHHQPAPTWTKINSYYIAQKRIFLTATPFRRDRKRMNAKLVYHYSLSQALRDQILRPIRFDGVDGSIHDIQSNSQLIHKAVCIWDAEKRINPNASILIRTNRIENATNLVPMYCAAGINVDVVHSDRTANANSEILNKVRDGSLDGVISVGIASEGLDIPNLKIAVLHSTPRSIPYTVQFLGRISRNAEGQEGAAILVANTNETRGEVRRLYTTDEAWGEIIPQVIDDSMRRARHYRSQEITNGDFTLPELNLFFSSLVYEAGNDFSFNPDFETREHSLVDILYTEQKDEDSPLLIITSYNKPIEWASREINIENQIDIHIFYHVRGSNLLFQLTSSEYVLDSFKSQLLNGQFDNISYGKLYKVLSDFNNSSYIMIGLKSAAMRGASHPAYKTVIGEGVQTAIRSTEGRVFYAGHALLRLSEDRTWGIATKKGRIWAMKRGTLEEYKEWCDSLARLITYGPEISNLPGLTFLARTYPVNTIDEKPIAIVFDDSFYSTSILIVDIADRARYTNTIPVMTPINIENGKLVCVFSIESFSCNIRMNLSDNKIWSVDANEPIRIRIDRNETETFNDTLEKTLNLFQPSLIMPDGSVIEGNNKIIPNRSIEDLPSDIWKKKVWANCAIMNERYQTSPNLSSLPVINKTIDFLRPLCKENSDVIVLDDGSNEIADVIFIQASSHTISLVHCKPSTTNKPGCRKGDCDIVFTQAMRSIHWVYQNNLFNRINYRLHGDSKIIVGDETLLTSIGDSFRMNEWQYKIIISQPGFDIDKVSRRERNNNNVYELAIPMYERIVGAQASIEIWGS